MIHLVIPDTHAKPGIDNDRFEWAARLALDVRPDTIIQLGDWGDFPSLSSYDKGHRSFEGRRYRKDVEAYIDANRRFARPLEVYNSMRRRNGKRQYRPRLVKLRGNHEERILRAAQMSPELEGVIDYSNLRDEEFGWETHDFLEMVEIDGIYYSHYLTAGNSRNAVGGQYPAGNLIRQGLTSCVCGHSHIRDFAERTANNGQRTIGLVAGCYFEHDEDWASPKQNRMWWRGLVLLHDVQNGTFDPEFININRARRLYG